MEVRRKGLKAGIKQRCDLPDLSIGENGSRHSKIDRTHNNLTKL